MEFQRSGRGMEEEFPSDLELTAASALLLLPFRLLSELHTSLPDFSDDLNGAVSKCEESGAVKERSATADAVSTDCSWLTTDGSPDDLQTHRSKIIYSFTAKLKGIRKRRTKIHWSFDRSGTVSSSWKKPNELVNHKNTSDTASEASCLSSSTSEISSARSQMEKEKKRNAGMTREEVKKRGMTPSNIHRRAEAILSFLSGGCSSEVRIRQVLGDSPDTSKALRMLLKRDEIRRSGIGGRSDPYIYKISGEAGKSSC